MFAKKSWHFTCYAVGLAAEKHPAAIKAMQRDGHEIASHNYKWINFEGLDEATEREYIRKAVKAIQAASIDGKTAPVSQHSRRLVWEEYKAMGLPLLYECDAYNDDLPYWVTVKGEGHLIIPYTLDQNDMKFSVAPGFGGPDEFYQYLKNTFDVLYQEGKEGSPKMMSVGLHCRLAGKPGRAAALQKFMDHVASHPDVWVATREEIAVHWRAVHPFS
ncbi:hypothetical protein HDV03_000744 [Kappamyces sp. JEL0829]|nr:hypothetical protein HDV03_000744 [Kappamyces sp. JEL0829]